MSLDSLLDTITNVVGFLVIVLAVLQLNVTWSPVSSSSSSAAVAPVSVRPSSAPALKVRLAELAMRIKDADSQLAGRTSAGALEQEKITLDEILRRLEKEIAELEKNVQNAKARLAGIQHNIDKVPPAPPPQPKVVISPRVVDRYSGSGRKPVWATKECSYFICRRGRVFPLNVDSKLSDRLKAGVRSALGKPQVQNVADLGKLVTYFKTRDVGDQYFRLSLQQMGTLLVMTFEPRSGQQGESAGQVTAGGTTFENVLRRHCNPRKNWVRFMVCADSFGVYLAARKRAEDAGLQVGWKPLENDFQFREAIVGGGGGGSPEGPDI